MFQFHDRPLELRTRLNLQVSFRFLEKHMHLVKLHCPLLSEILARLFLLKEINPCPGRKIMRPLTVAVPATTKFSLKLVIK